MPREEKQGNLRYAMSNVVHAFTKTPVIPVCHASSPTERKWHHMVDFKLPSHGGDLYIPAFYDVGEDRSKWSGICACVQYAAVSYPADNFFRREQLLGAMKRW